jgi:RHS repeat-associated protein
MKKLITYGFVLALSLVLVFHPALILAVTKAGSESSNIAERVRPIPPPLSKRPLATGKPRAIVQLAGQTETLLPDGRLLVIGGQGTDGPTTTIAIHDSRSGEITPLSISLLQARAWHTATMLPDGRVLVIGGLGASEKISNTAEIIDPATQTREVLPSTGSTFARAYHTATLLTSGQVLIVGGVSAQGRVLNRVDLWDFKTGSATNLTGKLNIGRKRQKATLQADGSVLIENGIDEASNEISGGEIFNVESRSFSLGKAPVSDQAPPVLAGSLPTDNSVDVPVDTLIALRFSKAANVETLNPSSIKLNGPHGEVATRIVPAEGGRLAFITPLPSLNTGTTYTVSVSGALEGNNPVAPAMFTFTTAGKEYGPGYDDEDWIPDANNLRGDWRSKRNSAEAQSLPPLQAEAGITALSGQVLTLNGRPLSKASLQIGTVSTQTDETGRFLLKNIATGHQVMKLDGRPASSSGRTYGVFKIGVDVVADKTNVLGFTIWMPKLDTAHAVNIQSPTSKEVSISNPHIPGLELRLPPQTVIRDMDGQSVTQISITPIPTNQPPFPLPAGVIVPVFFTIQPGGSQVIPPRARLIYPNFTNQRPGTRIDFWNYDAEEKGWYVYGQGTVSPNGRQIIPDPGVTLYEFSGAMVSNPSNAPPEGPPPCAECQGGDPVDLSTGLFVYDTTDLIVRDIIPIELKRTYRPRDTVSRPFGIGTTHPYEIFLVGDIFPYTFQDLILPDGGHVHYDRISPGTSFGDAVYEHVGSPSIFYKSTIRWIGGWELKLRDGTVYTFPDSEAATVPRAAAATGMRDRFGNSLTLARDSNHNLTQITTPNGRYIQFTYDASNRITQARDNIGRTVSYTYDGSGRLWKVTDVTGGLTQYGYDTSNRMTTIKDAKATTYITNQYDTNGRVTKQTMADNSVYQFAYTLGLGNKVIQTNVTDPRGIVRQVTFNSSGYMLTDTYALGKPEQQTITYVRQAGTNLLLSLTDPIARRTDYTYDSMGNQTSVTRLAGTSGAVTTNFTYESTFNLLTSITDPLNHTISFGYDASGRLISATDPLNHQCTFTYNTAGQMTSLTDPLQNTVQFGYEGGDLVTITDPLGHSVSRFIDDVGRVLALTNALGQITRFNYDAAGRPTRITDPLGGITSFGYDANGYLTSVTDPRNGVTSYTYNNMDRLASRKDSLLKSESYVYDAAGNITKYTDRRGKVTTFTYDNLNRQTFVGYGTVTQGQTTTYESTVTNTYDAANRLTRVVDSVGGTIDLGYDNLDRLTSESTPQGSVAYSYDNAGRRSSMTVAGQLPVNYSYDNANRLTGISQGPSSVTFNFDNANRPTSATLPNGLVVEYGYDANSQLTSINYRNGAALLGNLTYEYNGIGHRTNVNGSFARLGLPQTVSSVTYNAANQLTQKAGTTFTYDLNGNLTNDGVNTYTWNARNQLVSMSGPGLTASFQYDAFGRRVRKTINGTSTDYLYDGANAVQELSSGTPSANMLTGGLDNVFTRTDSAGTRTLLTDGLNSTLALTDSSGVLQTQYTYEPFGKATSSGATSNNSSQYTGRENDGTGLYYYRARYYSPNLQRFISEDPIGFLGGDANLYAYAANSPTNFIDPSGQWLDTLIDLGFIGYDLYSLATGSRKDLATNLAALGLDVAGALIPVATGLGAGYRAERAAVEGTEVVQRAMSRAELEATQRTGLLRGGREGTHYVSDAVNADAKRARQRLSLPQTPEVRVTMEVPKGSCSAPTKVRPDFNMPGGGTERTATGKVPVKITKVDPY